jgi:hypothetical protein
MATKWVEDMIIDFPDIVFLMKMVPEWVSVVKWSKWNELEDEVMWIEGKKELSGKKWLDPSFYTLWFLSQKEQEEKEETQRILTEE